MTANDLTTQHGTKQLRKLQRGAIEGTEKKRQDDDNDNNHIDNSTRFDRFGIVFNDDDPIKLPA